jgi:serine/threonine-protein kinase
MGEVYLAEDTRLRRNVAIKVLPAEFAVDPQRLARFEQEAKAAAALNHPHIAVVHDVGSVDDVHYMVQEYLEGDTLRAPLDKGALPIARALALGREIAAALGAAHAAGIVHRDLKPENVFVTQDGHAKVLDFGLAKLTEMALPASRMSMSPTVLGTVAGQVMGTAGYMAPEQVEGVEDIDHRADLFAFGCVLYEMVSGRRAFSGPTVLDTLHAIARTEPQSVGEIKPGLPVELQRILAKCLAKDRSARYQHADDLVVDLKNLAAAVESGTAAMSALPATAAATGRRVSLLTAALVTTALVALAALAGLIGGRALTSTPAAEMMVFDIELPSDARMNPAAGRSAIAISPDGNTVVYTAIDDNGTQWLFRRRIDELSSERITGSEAALTPTFSPNGDWLTFWAGGEIRKLPLEGGAATVLARVSGGQMPGWGDDGNIYFSDAGAIWRVSAAGGAPEVAFAYDGEGFIGPRLQVLPGSRGLLVEAGTGTPSPVFALDLATGEMHPVGTSGGRPTYTPAGYVLYASDGTLWARPFDVDTLQPTGSAMMVTQGVFTLGSGQARFAVSDDHKLIYGPQGALDSAGGAGLVWIDVEDGTEVERGTQSEGAIRAARVSPDGRRVMAAVERNDGARALFLYDRVQQTFQVFADQGNPTVPVWSPDGSSVYFSAVGENGSYDIFRQRADLSASREEILTAPGDQVVSAVSADGELLVFTEEVHLQGGRAAASETGDDVWAVPAEPGGEARPLIVGPGDDLAGALSPDGEWLAYTAERGDADEIWLRRLDGEGPGQKASTGHGTYPGWAPDGSTIFYNDGGALYGVRVQLGDDVRILPQEELRFSNTRNGNVGGPSFDAYHDADGRTVFVMSDAAFAGQTGDAEERIIVVLNWLELLRRQTSGQ